MKARCDWCGIQVEVLSDGKCLLGHPVRRTNRIASAAVLEPPPARAPAIGIVPARGARVRTPFSRTERRPKAPTLGEARPVARRSAVATATKPPVTDPPTRLPKATDAPTRMPKGAANRAAKPVARTGAPPRAVPRPAASSGSAAKASSTLRKWAPLDPFGPSGPVEIRIEEPPPVAVAAPAQPSPRPASPPQRPIPAATPRPAQQGPAASFADALRTIDWRSGAERTRDTSMAALRSVGGATVAAAAATARAGRTARGAIAGIDFRRMARRLGPLSPQNPVMWVAGLSIAGVALLIGLRVPTSERPSTQVLGSRVVAAAELTEVPGYVLEDDPATESEVAAQQPAAKKVSAANVRDGNKVLARYQAITFGPEIRWTPDRQHEWLGLYARGASVPPDAFTERPLGRRSVWSAPFGTGQVAILFYGSEVVVLVTGQPGAQGDAIVDAVLTARGV